MKTDFLISNKTITLFKWYTFYHEKDMLIKAMNS